MRRVICMSKVRPVRHFHPMIDSLISPVALLSTKKLCATFNSTLTTSTLTTSTFFIRQKSSQQLIKSLKELNFSSSSSSFSSSSSSSSSFSSYSNGHSLDFSLKTSRVLQNSQTKPKLNPNPFHHVAFVRSFSQVNTKRKNINSQTKNN